MSADLSHTALSNPSSGGLAVVTDAARLLATAPEPPLGRYLNRELSWLDFNERVLALAERRSLPLLERVKFIAIFSNNLDEFFQVRAGSLNLQLEGGISASGPDHGATRQRVSAIGTRVGELVGRAGEVFAGQLIPELATAGIRISNWAELVEGDREFLDDVFDDHIFSILTPLLVDPAQPLPFISNLSLNIAVVLRAPQELTRRIAVVEVPAILERFVVLPDGERFVPVEQLVGRRLAALFPGVEVAEQFPFRLTRNTDYTLDPCGADDMVAAVETVLWRRSRSETVVRLEVDTSTSEEALGLLVRELDLGDADVYRLDGLLDLGALWSIVALDRPELKLDPWTPVTKRRLAPAEQRGRIDFFSIIRAGDVLVQHPYDSFETSVEAFIEQAASDSSVVAIKLTLYRTSAPESRVMESLIRAAEDGKQVLCVVELNARFDEETNIAWAQQLQDAGVGVVYGVVGLKTHAKLFLAVRTEELGLRQYAHIGTGNYNPDTAQIYEDVGLFTADPDVTADVSDVFDLLTSHCRQQHFRTLLVAPAGLRSGLLELIREQSSAVGRITLKLNNLADTGLIDALYEAAQAGARIELFLRSICCLRPGATGLSETIRVRSIVGRYLEHSRILRFGHGPDATYLFGSADLMQRNLDRRVEVLAPVRDQALRERLDEIFDLLDGDDTLAWKLMPDGTWRPPSYARGINVQTKLEELALKRAHSFATV